LRSHSIAAAIRSLVASRIAWVAEWLIGLEGTGGSRPTLGRRDADVLLAVLVTTGTR
jgi:hypothetical protein